MAARVQADDKADFDRALDRFMAALQAYNFAVGFVAAEADIEGRTNTIIHLFIGPADGFPAAATLPENVAAEFAT